mgnify:CR=1 FL=1
MVTVSVTARETSDSVEALGTARAAEAVDLTPKTANLVTVDAYPRKDGHVVLGLTPKDFEVLEDGVPQAIDQFEFVRVEPLPESEGGM